LVVDFFSAIAKDLLARKRITHAFDWQPERVPVAGMLTAPRGASVHAAD